MITGRIKAFLLSAVFACALVPAATVAAESAVQDKTVPELSVRWSEEEQVTFAEIRKNGVEGEYWLIHRFDGPANISRWGGSDIEDNGEEVIEVRWPIMDAVPGETLWFMIQVRQEDGTVIETEPQKLHIPVTNAVSPIIVSACFVPDLEASVLEELFDQVAMVYINDGGAAYRRARSQYYKAAVSAEFASSDVVTALLVASDGSKDAFIAWGTPDIEEGDDFSFRDSLATAFAFRYVSIERGQYELRLYDMNERCLIGTWYFNVI